MHVVSSAHDISVLKSDCIVFNPRIIWEETVDVATDITCFPLDFRNERVAFFKNVFPLPPGAFRDRTRLSGISREH